MNRNLNRRIHPIAEADGLSPKKLVKIDRNGTILEEFQSISDAARKIGVKRESVRDCVLGRQKTCVGYIWKYK